VCVKVRCLEFLTFNRRWNYSSRHDWNSEFRIEKKNFFELKGSSKIDKHLDREICLPTLFHSTLLVVLLLFVFFWVHFCRVISISIERKVLTFCSGFIFQDFQFFFKPKKFNHLNFWASFIWEIKFVRSYTPLYEVLKPLIKTTFGQPNIKLPSSKWMSIGVVTYCCGTMRYEKGPFI